MENVPYSTYLSVGVKFVQYNLRVIVNIDIHRQLLPQPGAYLSLSMKPFFPISLGNSHDHSMTLMEKVLSLSSSGIVLASRFNNNFGPDIFNDVLDFVFFSYFFSSFFFYFKCLALPHLYFILKLLPKL